MTQVPSHLWKPRLNPLCHNPLPYPHHHLNPLIYHLIYNPYTSDSNPESLSLVPSRHPSFLEMKHGTNMDFAKRPSMSRWRSMSLGKARTAIMRPIAGQNGTSC